MYIIEAFCAREAKNIGLSKLNEHHKSQPVGNSASLEKMLQSWRSIFDAISDPVCLLDLEGKVLRCNQALTRLLDKPPHQIVGNYCFELLPVCADPVTDCPLARMKSTGRRASLTAPIGQRWFDITVDPFLDESGRLDGAVQVMKDVTEQKKIEEEIRIHRRHLEELVAKRTCELAAANRQLRQSQEMYRQIVETANEGIWIIDCENRTLFVNSKMADLLGYLASEMLGRPHTDFMDEDWQKKAGLSHLRRLKGASDQYEFRFRRKDGTNLWTIVSVSHLFEKGDYVGALAMITDITGRKWAEDALRASEERFSKAFNASPIPMSMHRTADWRCTDVNDSLLHTFGCRRGEVIGHNFTSLNIWANPGDIDRIMQKFSDQGYVKNLELILMTKHGDARTCLLSIEPIELGGRKYTLSVMNDVTELKQLEKEVLRLDRLNLVGEMAASIGHEIRNPITTVRGFLQMLGDKGDYQELKGHFDLMIEELDRANSIITEFLSLAKNKALDLKKRNIGSIIAYLYPLIQADAMMRDCSVKIEMEELPELLLDEKEIRQLILNLARNGLEAMRPGGTLTIGTFASGGEAVLSVRDEGPGIDPALLEKIGTPFFTTKDHGTGLGLAVCYSIAARHHSSIKVDTGPGGTTVYVHFQV